MRSKLFPLLLVFTIIILPSAAQIPANKLFAYSNGDLWTWFEGGNPEQITEWGYNGGPILAPDERYIAYLSIATEAVNEINTGQYAFAGTPPLNIWVMDTATQLAERIAEQDTYPVLRGIPAWSPSGRELAWLEFNTNSLAGMARLLVYDMDTRQTKILNDAVNLGFQDGGYYIHAVQWGSMGISRSYFSFVENGQLQFIIELYNIETGQRQDFITTVLDGMQDSATATPYDYVWVEHQAHSMIAILMNDGTWRLLNPLDGSMNSLSQAPNLINRNGNARLIPTWQANGEIQWQAANANATLNLPFASYSISNSTPALSPDGSAVAWNNNGDLAYQPIGGSVPAFFHDSPEDFAQVTPTSIVWSSLRWVTNGGLGGPITSPVLDAGNACNLASRLTIGNTVTVNEGAPNNVRSEARLSAPVIAYFAPTVLAEVVDGPICADGFRWWYVQNANFAGWTAEGNASEYWLEAIGG